MMKIPGKITFLLLLAAFSLAACSSSTADKERPPEEPTGSPPARFTFETSEDDLSLALRDAYVAYRTSPANPEEGEQLVQKQEEAWAQLRDRADEAAAALIADFDKLDPLDIDGQLSIFHLLGGLDSSAGLTFLHGKASQELPAEVPDPNGEETPHSLRATVAQIRIAAVSQLGRRAGAGNAEARGHLLDLVENGDRGIRKQSIQFYYRSAPLRWKAKREMAAKLAPSERFLLHKIY